MKTPPSFITRFAPSPTGYLHLGHAFAARFAFEAARAVGGVCHLRIEDTDRTRCKPAFDAAIADDLHWLGFSWPEPVRRQSDHRADYDKALTRLHAMGLVYRCFKTRKEVIEAIDRAPHLPLTKGDTATAPQKPPFTGGPITTGEEMDLMAEGKPYAWRLSMARCRDHLGADWSRLAFREEKLSSDQGLKTQIITVVPDLFGDEIIARKDTHTSYHLACVHDDAHQNISHVVRGNDLFAVTHLHVVLQTLLGYPTPIYRHHPLLTDDHGERLAKRNQSVTLRHLREMGKTPEDIFARIDEMTAHRG
ncbi:MAG: tRNA glutamyl-Q(34) synthetase GluQRS [Pseudomonadota bacterium]